MNCDYFRSRKFSTLRIVLVFFSAVLLYIALTASAGTIDPLTGGVTNCHAAWQFSAARRNENRIKLIPLLFLPDEQLNVTRSWILNLTEKGDSC